MRRADRLFRIVQLLRRRKLTTARQLADELEISERTVYRDVADLMVSGVPIRGEAGVGYALDRGFDLPPLMFTEDELEALVLGARVVESWADATLAKAAREAVQKVEAVLPERLQGRIGKATMFAPGFHVPVESTRELGTLRRAIRERLRARLAYVDRAAAATERTIRPLGLFFWGHSWTVAAWCELRDGFRGFRLDRVQKLELTDQTFEDAPGQTLDDFFEHVRKGEDHMKLGYTILYVADVKRSLEFWERAFGLQRRMLDDKGLYAELETGPTTLSFVAHGYIRDSLPGGFRPAQVDEAPPPFEVALTTDDVAGAVERAVQAGARKVLAPTKKPWGQTVAYVRDCDGNLVELCTPMG